MTLARRLAIVLVVALLGLTETSQAEPVHAVNAALEVAGSARFMGRVEATGDSTGLTYDIATADPIQISAAMSGARVRVLNLPYVAPRANVPGVWNWSSHMTEDSEVWRDDVVTGDLVLTKAVSGSLWRFLPNDPDRPFRLALHAEQTFDINPPLSNRPMRLDDGLREKDPNINRSLRPPATSAIFVSTAVQNLTLEGNLFVLLFGGEFGLTDSTGKTQTIWTGPRLNTTRTVTAPIGASGLAYYDQVILIIQGEDIQLGIRNPYPARLQTSFQNLEGKWSGDFTFSKAKGSLAVDGEELEPDALLLQTIGNFDARANYSGGKGSWGIQGSASFVGLDGQTYVGVRPGAADPQVVLVAAGISLLAVIGYLIASWIRRGAVYVGSKAVFLKWLTFAPLTAKLAPHEILAHPARKALVEMLRNEFPYVQLKVLTGLASERLGLASSTLYKHLRVLYVNEQIDILRPSSMGQIFVASNHGLIKQRHSQVAASLLHRPVGLIVAQAFLANPGVTQKELITAVQQRIREEPEWAGGRTISGIGVLKWIRKFESFHVAPRTGTVFGTPTRSPDPADAPKPVELVRRQRDGRVVRYWPTDFLTAVVQAFQQRPDALGQALSDIEKRRGPPSPPPSADPSIA